MRPTGYFSCPSCGPGVLGTESLLVPLQGMIDSLLDFPPNRMGAGIIILVGWFVVRILHQIGADLLVAVGTGQDGFTIIKGGRISLYAQNS